MAISKLQLQEFSSLLTVQRRERAYGVMLESLVLLDCQTLALRRSRGLLRTVVRVSRQDEVQFKEDCLVKFFFSNVSASCSVNRFVDLMHNELGQPQKSHPSIQ
jgi:hypothetical protein